MPINFRLSAEEVGYIVEHSGASVLLVDPELDDAELSGVGCQAPLRDRRRDRRGAVPVRQSSTRTGVDPDENATATINYTSGTTARPEGRAAHAPQRSGSTRRRSAGTSGSDDRDVYLHTLPMFHCNGWGMPYAVTGMGGTPHRAAQGRRRRDPAPRRDHGVTLMCGAPAVVAAILDAAAGWEGEIPGRGRTRIVVAGAPPPTRTIERIETELGWEFIQIYGLTETSPLLTMNRSRAEYDDLDAGRPRPPPGPHRRAGPRRADRDRRRGRGAGPEQRRDGRLLEPARGDGRRHRRRLVPHRRRRVHRRRRLPHDLRPQEGRDHLRRRERVVDRGRGLRSRRTPRSPRSRSSACPTRSGARR